MFTSKMKRKKYILLSLATSIFIFALAVFLGGTFSQKVNGIDMLKIYSTPWYFLMTVFFLRRVGDVLGKEGEVYINIALAATVTLLGAFVPIFKPKFLLIPFVLIAFFPSKQKVEPDKEVT